MYSVTWFGGAEEMVSSLSIILVFSNSFFFFLLKKPYVCVYIYIYVYTYMYIYIYMYIYVARWHFNVSARFTSFLSLFRSSTPFASTLSFSFSLSCSHIRCFFLFSHTRSFSLSLFLSFPLTLFLYSYCYWIHCIVGSPVWTDITHLFILLKVYLFLSFPTPVCYVFSPFFSFCSANPACTFGSYASATLSPKRRCSSNPFGFRVGLVRYVDREENVAFFPRFPFSLEFSPAARKRHENTA